jgi:indolepyruvate ferredoxin oxidoreductase beta subunit
VSLWYLTKIEEMMQPKAMNFVLVGVGGQGTILASDILAELGLRLGLDVKKAEVHGMSQRGGSVVSHLRWGPRVYSPIIARGEADILVAFEKLEAARFCHWLRPGGIALVNDTQIVPASVAAAGARGTAQSGGAAYPADDTLQEIIRQRTRQSYWIAASAVAEGLGNSKAANVVLLGALSLLLDCDLSDWLAVLKLRVPAKHLDLNRQAFEAGRAALLESLGEGVAV